MTIEQHLDLFSGIGGFSLGFEREGFSTIAFCESEEHLRTFLKRRWSWVPLYLDASDHSGLPVPGFVSGRQEGGAVGLKELANVRDSWIVAENSGHRWRSWVPELRRALWAFRYSSVPLSVRASEVGACHERHRVIVIAHTDSERLRELSRWWSGQGRQVADELAESWDSAPRGLGTYDGLPNWVDRRHALGNAVCPPVAQLVAKAIRSVT